MKKLTKGDEKMSTENGELIDNAALIEKIKEILQSIEEKYRKAAKFEGSEVYYERPFCYEFFHKFRIEQENTNSLISKIDLHCELPKGYRNLHRTPDFVIHKQNTDDKNLIVIEVSRFLEASNSKILEKIKDEIGKFNDYHITLNYQYYIELVLTEYSKLDKIREYISNKRGTLQLIKNGSYKIYFWFYDIDSGKLQDSEEVL